MFFWTKYQAAGIFWFFVRPLQKLYWFKFRPNTRGVKCVIRRDDGAVLLVRLNYAHRWWTLPGGDVGRNESYEQAAYRELYEESGVTGVQLSFCFEYEQNIEYKQDVVQVFEGHVGHTSVLTVDGIEILEAGWFLSEALPLHTSPRAVTILGKISEVAQRL